MNLLYYCHQKLADIDDYLNHEEPDRIIMSDDSDYRIFLKDNLISKVIIDNKDSTILNIHSITDKWFRDKSPRNELFLELSKISRNRRKFHNPDWFKKNIISIKFKHFNNEIVPYRYYIKKQ